MEDTLETRDILGHDLISMREIIDEQTRNPKLERLLEKLKKRREDALQAFHTLDFSIQGKT